jgi:hypothetical protein
MQYSVAEGSESVELTVVKKILNMEITFGYRTVADTATSPKDYWHVEKIVTMGKREQEKIISIPINNDEDWQPDLDFFVELYDPVLSEQVE